ncbi:hypothetical protein ACVIHH_001352 [Bradyrhizobium sp. USDA 4518]
MDGGGARISGAAWRAVFAISGYPVYLPWRSFEWWFAYEPEIFEEGGAIAAAGGIAGALFAILSAFSTAALDRRGGRPTRACLECADQ